MTTHKDVGDGDEVRLVSTFGYLRARDEAIIDATLSWWNDPCDHYETDYDAIIAAAEQEPTP